MLTDEEWHNLSSFYNGAVYCVLAAVGSDGSKSEIVLQSANVTVVPSQQRKVNSNGQVTWSEADKKGKKLRATFPDSDRTKEKLVQSGTEVSVWVNFEASSWLIFTGWISAPPSRTFGDSSSHMVSIRASDNADYPDTFFETNAGGAMLVLRSMKTVKEVMQYVCSMNGWTLRNSSGLDKLESVAGSRLMSLFEGCNSHTKLLDKIIIENGFAYYIERVSSTKVEMTIVGPPESHNSYVLVYPRGTAKSGNIPGPYEHLTATMDAVMKTRAEASLPQLFSAPSIRVLSIDSVKPTKNQYGSMGGIINTARVLATIDQNGEVTWRNTMFTSDVLQPDVIWIDTKEQYPWVAAASALKMSADEFRKRGWVVQVVDLGVERVNNSDRDLSNIGAEQALGFEATIRLVGFPYVASHDVITLSGSHEWFESRTWRAVKWSHSYRVGRGWYTTLNLGT